MRYFSLFFVFFLVVSLKSATAQDTLTLLNGDIRLANVLSSDSSSVTYTYLKRKKEKTRTLSNELIFSISYQTGSDTILYQQGESNHELSESNMQLYLLGMHDAKTLYKAPWVFVGGIVFNAGVGYLLYDNFWAASGPILYTAGTSFTKVKITTHSNRATEIMSNPLYQQGFLKVAKSKKVYNALTGSLVGLVVGITIGHATN